MFKFVSLQEGFMPIYRPTFREAFIDMYNWITQQQSIAMMILETAIWIETPGPLPLYFYEAKDLALDQGILKPTGKLA